MKSQIQRHLDVLRENAVDVVSEDELRVKLENSLLTNTPLKLKIGFDPTARDIHLGHTVLLRKLRKLQDLGHFVYLVIGDFTAKIGDPSGRNSLRPILSDDEIRENATTYTEQAFKILDEGKTKIIYNSIWYKQIKLSSFLSILSSYTVARVLEREDFSQRIKENRPLTLLEIIYPLIQGYDSVMLEADIEFGGTDQKFNLIVGRHLQEVFNQKPQGVVTMPLLVGLDGKNKMSKSLGNYIGVTDEPQAMFGKVMSINDEVMWEYFRLLTDAHIPQMKTLHPKEAKLQLAQTIVSFYAGIEAGRKARDEFERVFSHRELPGDITTICAEHGTVDLLDILMRAGMVSSKNEARRLLSQGGISAISEQNPTESLTITEQSLTIPSGGVILKIGKKKFLKIQ
ncbi:MAG: tyrosine--tRNA ligase [Candidatus Omnitrophota bacterium]